MDALFRQTTGVLTQLLRDLNEEMGSGEKEEGKREIRAIIRKIIREADRLDQMQRIATCGFEKVNREISEKIYQVAFVILKEAEHKEIVFAEAQQILADAQKELEPDSVEHIIEHGHVLSKYSKCPLLWTEDLPLPDTFPVFPADIMMQKSALRVSQRSAAKSERKEKKEKKQPESPMQSTGFTFEF